MSRRIGNGRIEYDRIGVSSVKHVDKRDTVGSVMKFRKGGGQDWRVVKSGYVRTGGPNVPFITGDIEEDELENTVSYNGKTVPFCPRGWIVDPTGALVLVPTALALFSYLEAVGDADVITYDEAENTG